MLNHNHQIQDFSEVINHEDVDLLRFITAGSVDDGKSTLIGRLLYDSKSIFEDQLNAITSELNGEVNLAHLTDGLRAEREQGITIDVAYRYFATRRRKFIIADSPGHVQYTRNMVTAASTANLAIIIVDARNGITEQTRRHSFIASLLRNSHLVVCVNKMDLVDYSESTFDKIRKEFRQFAACLQTRDISFIPISALKGDNIVESSNNMPWYQGGTLLYHLENVVVVNDRNRTEMVLPIQWVVRHEASDYRGYAGQVAGGILKPGDRVMVLPSGQLTRVKRIHLMDKDLQVAVAPMSISVELEDNLDIGRGDVLVHEKYAVNVGKEAVANVCWMSNDRVQDNRKYILKQGPRISKVIVKGINFRVSTDTLEEDKSVGTLGLNEIGQMRIKSTTPLIYDSYSDNRTTGSFVLIDEVSHETVAAGLFCEPGHNSLAGKSSDYVI